ncbi:MAG TPA: DUF6600 domain-containing protein [Bryobacteraceae bacterium]|jgi:hypothetical protein
MTRTLLVSASALALVASIAWADDDDPPGRAARLSYISGTVSFQPGSVEDWVPATLNRPMTTGDRLWTEAGARAEMNFGSAAVRMDGRTNLAVMNLDDRTAQLQISAGTLSVRLRRLADDETFEIDTPQMALTLLRPGEYRVEVNEQGDATIAGVRGGEAEANAGTQSVTVHPREQLRVMGADQPVLDTRTIPPADPFDNFCEERDRREDMSVSAQHVSRDIPGYQDLDGAGVWREDPQYGWIWGPRAVPVGWAPYHYGHWAWIAPWGWTWVDDAPWGYAPFHYGRWVFVGGGWAWVPGPVVPRPVYAPAMVAWVGGGGFSVGVALGGGPAVGWFPLGPREVWVPAYHYSPVYIERVNVTNTVIVNRTVFNNVNVTRVTYVNRNVAGAVTVVPQSAMTGGRPVAISAVRVAPEVVARAEVRNVAVVAPERTAVLGARVQASAAPPAAVMRRTIVARATPPAPPPSFAQQQQILRQNPGQPIPRARVAQLQQNSQAQPGGAAQRPAIRQVGRPIGAQNGGGGASPAAASPAGAINPPGGPPPRGGPGPRSIPSDRSTQAAPAPAAPAQGAPQSQIRRQPPSQAPETPAQNAPEYRRRTPQQPAAQPSAPAPRTESTPAQQNQPQLRRNAPPSGGSPRGPAAERPNQRQREKETDRENRGKQENRRREDDR